jgi:hypothetical protein
MWHGCGGCIKVIRQKHDKGKCALITIYGMVINNEDARALIKINMEVGLEKKQIRLINQNQLKN